jgi:carboxyl-terminal processing protease
MILRKHILSKTFLVLLAVVLIGFVSAKDPFFEIKKNFTLFSEVVREIQDLYVVEVSPERLIRTGINAMLESLDPYTVLIDEADTQEIDFMTTGRYAGVGIEAGARNGQLVVIAPIDGYAAARAGIRPGDIIIQVNGISSSELNAEDLNAKLRGEPGSKVVLKIQRFGIDELLEFELIRERIEIKNVPFFAFADKENGIGYVVLSRFSNNAAEEIKEAILQLKEEAELKSLILDLRNNPGGLLSEAVKTVDIFIPQGKEVVLTRGKNRQSRQIFLTERNAFLETQPVVILQNQGSASSSEIVAGALQDYDRAIIVGEQSFGKGLVQIIRPLSYSNALKITTSNYFIPSGRSIQSVNYGTSDEDSDELTEFFTKAGRVVFESTGISPDVHVDTEPSNMLEIALIRHNSFFFFANEFVAENPKLTLNDDQLFNAFINWLEKSDFTYETRAERLLAQLETQLSEDYSQGSPGSDSISKLRNDLLQLRKIEKEHSKNIIIRELRLELSARYEGTTGRQLSALSLDPVIIEAKRIINDRERYQALLKP